MKLVRSLVIGILMSAPLLADITSVPTYPGGQNESVQVNKRGTFYGDSRFVYSTSTFRLSVPQIVITTATINGTTYYFPTSQTGGYFLRTDGTGNLTWASPTTVVTSTATDLAILDGNSVIAPNTSTVTFNSSQFIISLLGSTTASISLDPSSVTVMGPLSASTPLTLTGSTFGIDTSTFAMLGSNNHFSTSGNSTSGNVFWSTVTAGGGTTSAVKIVSTTSVANVHPVALTLESYGSTGISGWSKAITAVATGSIVNTAAEFSASGGTINYGLHITTGLIKQPLKNTIIAADADGVLTSTTVVGGSGSGAATLPLPGGATNYIQNSSSLQSGATFYVSSGSVLGQFSAGSLSVSGTTSINGNLNVSSGVALSGSAGVNGQVLTSAGPGTVPVWTTPLSFSGAAASAGPFTGFYLKDVSNNKWYVSVTNAGNLVTTSTTTVNGGSLYRSSIVTQDSSAAYWTISVSTLGNLVTTPGGTAAQTILDLLINDLNGFSWVVTVSTLGNLVTS